MIWYSILDIDNNVFYNWSDPGDKKDLKRVQKIKTGMKKISSYIIGNKDQEKRKYIVELIQIYVELMQIHFF